MRLVAGAAALLRASLALALRVLLRRVKSRIEVDARAVPFSA